MGKKHKKHKKSQYKLANVIIKAICAGAALITAIAEIIKASK